MQVIVVSRSPEEFEDAVSKYLAQGYSVVHMTAAATDNCLCLVAVVQPPPIYSKDDLR